MVAVCCFFGRRGRFVFSGDSGEGRTVVRCLVFLFVISGLSGVLGGRVKIYRLFLFYSGIDFKYATFRERSRCRRIYGV